MQQKTKGGSSCRWLRIVWTPACALALLGNGVARAAPEIKAARQLCHTGRYEACVAAAQEALGAGAWTEDWHLLLIRGLEAVGRPDQALAAAETLERRYSDNLDALLALHHLRRTTGDPRTGEVLERIRKVFSAPGRRLSSAHDLVTAGVAALRLGDDPRSVLQTYFEPAAKKDPSFRETYLAAGRLALARHDDALAARWFRQGRDKLGPDPDIEMGLARAFQRGETREMLRALDAALKLNPRLVPALLLRAEHAIDGEDYPAAATSLEAARAVDADHPLAWAFTAVLAHLRNDARGEAAARARALGRWAGNPEVDSLIGRKLSEKYRFVEGAAAQRRALKLDPSYLPARALLAQDLLRLGNEKEGWALVDEVHARDGYDVVAFNLVTLHQHVEKMASLGRGDFLVRMDPREAPVWGDAALSLLREARATVDRKYGVGSAGRGRPVKVEIFSEQSDFAVRTFGLPGGAAYLGVCFGPLITMNSPAGNVGVTANWKAVLWHEYTHVVTLGLTHNKMPRWLSEGISVYEETRRDPAWGQPMTPRFREMILGGELLPVGRLSAAFVAPKDGEHLMFAYFQSSLVVELIVERHGMAALRAVLHDLGEGAEINQALAAHTLPLPELEKAFEAFARSRAKAGAPRADLAKLRKEAQALIEAQKFKEAKVPLGKLLALDPEDRGADSGYLLLALVHRKLGEIALERQALERLAALSGDAQPAYARLIELALQVPDWPAVARNAERMLAVSPMTASAHRALGQSLEERAGGDSKAAEGAVAEYRKVLLLGPADPADLHLRLARLLRPRDPRAARRQVLDALAEAPRFREAQRLLLEMHQEAP